MPLENQSIVKRSSRQFLNITDHLPATQSDTRSDLFSNALLPNRNVIDGCPFVGEDITAGVENELQVVVIGDQRDVDLPITITESNYYKNIIAEAKTGNSPRQMITSLEAFLENNPDKTWENSWVMFPQSCLTSYANEVFERDLLRDKTNIFGPTRSDKNQFFRQRNGQTFIRVPISYLLKIALADLISKTGTNRKLVTVGNQLMRHFLSDNTSPETFSFSPMRLSPKKGSGLPIVEETLLRFLLCQLLVQYANTKFELPRYGQRAMVYFAPNPATRQKQLNELITDSFYRELFMSPCLSGWDLGEEKKEYMALCHKVLSLSQLNAIYKLKEAGILAQNLIVLPNTSNTSLANNGTHISLGSDKLTQLLKDPDSGFTAKHEKYVGDLVIKIMEHFLPLFAGVYSAAPYRLDFCDFHPEQVLGFLPHELEVTHLKMIWRRWKKKAGLKLMGQPVTPFGPIWLDRMFSRLFNLKGDFVPDYRLVDYFVSLLSTEQSPALNGALDNDIQLKRDLSSMGVFDESMSAYLLCKLRQCGQMGFSGFEGRFYSLFKEFSSDMKHAVNLQTLIVALAYMYAFQNRVSHADIPDSPFLESERRQIFFSAAIGVPTVYVRGDTPNRFLRKILEKTAKTRNSRRYEGFVRVKVQEYLRALVTILQVDGQGIIRENGLEDTIQDLNHRLESSETASVSGKLTSEILKQAGVSSPMKLSGREFNSAAETYYRDGLRRENMKEALNVLARKASQLDSMGSWRKGDYNEALMSVLNGKNAAVFVELISDETMTEKVSRTNLEKLIQLLLLVIDREKRESV